jgi:hypothetical protein
METISLTLGFVYKAGAVGYLMQNMNSERLPSHREAQVQLEKFKRMTNTYMKKFPAEVIRTVPGKKTDKLQGQHMHRLHLQNKVVDKFVRRLLIEMVRATPGTQHFSDKTIRIEVQKYAEHFNRELHKNCQQKVREAYSLALKFHEIKNLGPDTGS